MDDRNPEETALRETYEETHICVEDFKTEYWLYISCNMTVMLNLTIDLMCSPKFDIRNLNRLRTIGWEVQKVRTGGQSQECCIWSG